MSAKTLATLAIAALLTVPATLLLASPAARAEDVPQAPGVAWVPQVGFQQTFYPVFQTRGGQPDCASTGTLAREPMTQSTLSPRASCPFTTATAASPGTSATFAYPSALVRNFNISSPIHAHIAGTFAPGQTFTVTFSASTSVSGTHTVGDSSESGFDVDLVSPTGLARTEFAAGQVPTLTVSAVAGAVSSPGPVPTVSNPVPGSSAWSYDDVNSRIVITSDDAYRAATWTGDQNTSVLNIFRPVDNNSTSYPLIRGYFALQSAWGQNDVTSGGPSQLGPPTLRIFQGNELANPFPGAKNSFTGEKLAALSPADKGVQTWGFPTGQLDYRGWRPGQYQLKADITYPHSNGIKAGITWDFTINSQGVRLSALTDTNTTPNLVESVAHTVPGGQTTTFLLTATNIGSANDTFRIATQFVPIPGSPQNGWAATPGGPQLLGDTVQLAPSQSKIVAITVTTPFATSGSGSFLITATSVTDPSITAPAMTLVATLGNNGPDQDVGILAQGGEIAAQPGKDNDVPVYVWNRASHAANLSLDITTADGAWTTAFVSNGGLVRHLALPNVPPGAIVATTLRAHAPDNSLPFDVHLNATNNDVTGVTFDRVVRLKLDTVGGYKVEVLDRIGNLNATVEVSTCANGGSSTGTLPLPLGAPDPTCDQASPDPDDGPDFILLRTWITNTGRQVENVNVGISSLTRASSNTCTDTVFPTAADLSATPPKMKLVTRTASGALADFGGTIAAMPVGNTTELYVQVAVDRTQPVCLDSKLGRDFFSFVVTATGQVSQISGAYSPFIYAEDTGGIDNVLVQSAQRDFPSGNPATIRSALAATRPIITQGVQIGGFTTFYVRVTDAASWAEHAGANGALVRANVTVSAQGVDYENGWNISMRPVNGDLNNLTNPYNSSYSFGNVDPTAAEGEQRQAMRDVELEVRVFAPDGVNHTALAGAPDQITLVATQGKAASYLSLRAIVSDFASIDLAAKPRTAVHSGESGAALVYLYNNGSAPATVTLSATMDRDATPNPDAWRVEPSPQSFVIGAFRNRSVALTITPPAGSGSGLLHLVAVYAADRNAPEKVTTLSRDIPVDVLTTQSQLTLTAPARFATTSPGHSAIFTFNVTNRGGSSLPYVITGTQIPNWTTVLSPSSGTLGAGQSTTFTYLLGAPSDVFANTSYDSLVTVSEEGNPDDFSVVPVTVGISGGSAVPSISTLTFQKTIDRASNQSFELSVRNLGNAAGTLPLSAKTNEPGWTAVIQDATGHAISSILVPPNELRTVLVNITAPLAVAENKAVTVTITASNPEGTSLSTTTVRALVHDYGVAATLPVSTVDMVPGIAQEYILHVTNTGNDNDTLNVSAMLLPATDFTDWVASVSPDRVFLGPGQSVDVHATLRAPTTTLPSARAYPLRFYVGTVGGALVNVSKNVTIAAVANIIDYRPLDVDGDSILELAIDQDKTKSNGYEVFREISGDGFQCVVVSNSRLQGTARFFLDCTSDTRSLDGVADVWFDPDSVYAYKITMAPDINKDGTPEYLLDTDRDGKIDSAYDTITERYWTVTEIHTSAGTTQYLVDTNGDGRADYYADVANNVMTKTLTVADHPDLIGLDTKNNGHADKYYDPASQSVTGATASNLASFFANNWYFVLGFLALVVIVVVLIVVRARRGKGEP